MIMNELENQREDSLISQVPGESADFSQEPAEPSQEQEQQDSPSEQPAGEKSNPPGYDTPSGKEPKPPRRRRPPRERRVGSVTLGIALVFTGLMILYSFFGEPVNLIRWLKFSPIILVFMGIEIIISTFLCRRVRFKYDILGIFLCGFLILASLGGSIVAGAGGQYLKAYDQMSVAFQSQQEKVDAALLDNHTIRSAQVEYRHGSSVDWVDWIDRDIDVQRSLENSTIHVELIQAYDDPVEFCRNAVAIVDSLRQNSIEYRALWITSSPKNADSSMTLRIASAHERQMGAQELSALVEIEPVSSYSYEESYE